MMVKRYGPWKDRGGWSSILEEEKDGGYVLYSDYDALEARVKELEAVLRRIAASHGASDHGCFRRDLADAALSVTSAKPAVER